MVIASTLLALALLGPADDDVVILNNGDRISGKVVSKGRKILRLQTPYGLLQIGLDKIERLHHADGTEELLTALPAPATAPTPTPKPAPPVKLVFTISGKTFWQAWDAEAAPADPTLRLDLRVDDHHVAAWVDSKVDPGEIPKAVVNSFSFTPDTLKVAADPGVKVLPPEIRPGRIQLGLELPADFEGPRKLRLAYQGNAGSPTAPEWRDLVLEEVTMVLGATVPNLCRVEQDRGNMEFSKRHMKNVETFKLALKLDTPGAEP